MTKRIMLAAVCGALVLSACGSAAEKITEQATEELIERGLESEGGGDVEIDFDEDGGSLSFESDDGSFEVSGDADVPDGFPDVVILPDGLYILSGARQSDGDEEIFTIIGSMSQDVDDFLAELEDAYGDAAASFDSDAMTQVAYEDVDGWDLNYTVTRDAENGFTVNVFPAS